MTAKAGKRGFGRNHTRFHAYMLVSVSERFQHTRSLRATTFLWKTENLDTWLNQTAFMG